MLGEPDRVSNEDRIKPVGTLSTDLGHLAAKVVLHPESTNRDFSVAHIAAQVLAGNSLPRHVAALHALGWCIVLHAAGFRGHCITSETRGAGTTREECRPQMRRKRVRGRGAGVECTWRERAEAKWVTPDACAFSRLGPPRPVHVYISLHETWRVLSFLWTYKSPTRKVLACWYLSL